MNAKMATNANVTRIDRIILRLLSVGSCRHPYPHPLAVNPGPPGEGRLVGLGLVGAGDQVGGVERLQPGRAS
jgi:hypothetical protein